MCGLVALVSAGMPLTVQSLVDMTRALRHRGPDDEGYLVEDGDRIRLLSGADTPDNVLCEPTESRPEGATADIGRMALHVGLGHRRLSIVDLSAHGHQPMRRANLTVVFNGEIYDHVERRAELERLGCRFTSGSDTEVLLAAYATWGTDAFRRINGMWACAIYDAQQRKLLIARDRFGVKPLYWWQGPGGELALASEIKALLAHPRVAARPDIEACARLIHAGPESWRSGTAFIGIRRFPAGHWAEVAVDSPGPVQPRSYWELPPIDDERLQAPFAAPEADRLAEEYRSLLDDAVRIRMRMDVRFGTALSGGLDSSQIAMLVNGELRRRGSQEQQEVFSSVYLDNGDAETAVLGRRYRRGLRAADESGFIASVARQLDVRSNLIKPKWRDIPVEHAHMIWALDTPPVNTLMSSWHTYGLVARRGVVVTLDGQGADEQLAGYVYYARNLLVQSSDTWCALRQAAALARNMRGIGLMLGMGLAGHAVRRLLGQRRLHDITAAWKRGQALAKPLVQALREDFTTHLQTLLFYADKSSMAWSVESRMPYMDWRLVNFLCNLPLTYRIRDGWTKWLARHAMRNALPDQILWRRDKIGWAIPEAAWFGRAGPLNGWLDQQIASSKLALEVAAITGVAADRGALPTRLRLLNLAVWSRLYFEESGRPGRPLGRAREIGSA
jgi:asparagine synthase (glutamine-hydrolysing)